MSMTQVVFLREANVPTIKQIEEIVQRLGYDLKIGGDPNSKIGNEGLECSINGHETYFETDVARAEDTIASLEADWIQPDLTDQGTAISFYWGADFAAGACIGLISAALIEYAEACLLYG